MSKRKYEIMIQNLIMKLKITIKDRQTNKWLLRYGKYQGRYQSTYDGTDKT